MDDVKNMVKQLIAHESEEDWFEFKDSWYDANGIGEYISSLSNAAAVHGKERAYLIWGVNNETHELTNTTFDAINYAQTSSHRMAITQNE